MQRCLLGIDLGSGSIRACVYALDGTLIAIASRPTEKLVPNLSRPDEVVWPHENIWNGSCAAIREVISALPSDMRIEAVSVACLGMDGLPIDADGQELYPFISWHDLRTVALSDRWKKTIGYERQFMATGNKIYGFNTVFRLQWMALHQPEILAKTHKWVLIGDYLNFKLCGRLATDYTMANCTLLFDPLSKKWSEELMAFAGVNPSLLCEPYPSGTVLGGVTKSAAAATGLSEGTPIILGAHDYLLGVLPVGGFRSDTIVNVAGTWDIVQAVSPVFAPRAEMAKCGLTYECHAASDLYSIHGAAIAGAALEWFKSELGSAFSGQDWDTVYTQALERGPQGLLFLPHLSGGACPELDPHSAGALIGLRSSHTKSDILAAMCQGLAFQNAVMVRTLDDFGVSANRMVMVGGAAGNRAAVQTRANILGKPIEISELTEATALGAAMIAGIGVGAYAHLDDAYERVCRPGLLVEPEQDQARIFRQWMPQYESLYGRLAPVHHALSANMVP